MITHVTYVPFKRPSMRTNVVSLASGLREHVQLTSSYCITILHNKNQDPRWRLTDPSYENTLCSFAESLQGSNRLSTYLRSFSWLVGPPSSSPSPQQQQKYPHLMMPPRQAPVKHTEANLTTQSSHIIEDKMASIRTKSSSRVTKAICCLVPTCVITPAVASATAVAATIAAASAAVASCDHWSSTDLPFHTPLPPPLR